MNDFSKEVVTLIETLEPAMKNNVKPGMVSAETKPPYAAYSEPTEEPKRTKDGIAGYRTTFELAIFNDTKVSAERLKNSLKTKLDRQIIAGRKMLFMQAEYGFYEDYKLHGYVLTFNIK